MNLTLGVIGCGQMGSALIRAVLAGKLLPSSRIVGWDVDSRKCKGLGKSLKIRNASSALQAASARVVILAVKPAQMEAALGVIREGLTRRTLVISVAAGISTRWIERKLRQRVAVVRAMPNTPAKIQAGITAIARGRFASGTDLKHAEKLLGCAGEVVRVSERKMDAVTAISGSGPAYFFFLMEKMIQSGIQLGLTRAVSRRLVLRTALGSAGLAVTSAASPETLRRAVTSKGGTTEAALAVFKRLRVGEGLTQGMRRAARKAKELGR